MFKYGSIRNFVVKFVFGIVLFGFGLICLISLYSFSPNDPGFNQLNYNNKNDIENFLGYFGAYLSSYLLVFVGTLSYLLFFFLTLEGGKLFLGISSRLIILKFLSNLTGIIIINISLKSIDIPYLKTGLFSQFVIDLSKSINFNFEDNIIVYFIINFSLLFFGIFLILLSFRINFSWLNKIASFFKFFKYFGFIFSYI